MMVRDRSFLGDGMGDATLLTQYQSEALAILRPSSGGGSPGRTSLLPQANLLPAIQSLPQNTQSEHDILNDINTLSVLFFSICDQLLCQ